MKERSVWLAGWKKSNNVFLLTNGIDGVESQMERGKEQGSVKKWAADSAMGRRAT